MQSAAASCCSVQLQLLWGGKESSAGANTGHAIAQGHKADRTERQKENSERGEVACLSRPPSAGAAAAAARGGSRRGAEPILNESRTNTLFRYISRPISSSLTPKIFWTNPPRPEFLWSHDTKLDEIVDENEFDRPIRNRINFNLIFFSTDERHSRTIRNGLSGTCDSSSSLVESSMNHVIRIDGMAMTIVRSVAVHSAGDVRFH